ncbi:MAG: hypothetical protein GX301_03640 [Gracilibacteraceae bacterium]|nr:hypothetical protein [Gracilibacteraceae bacterium]
MTSHVYDESIAEEMIRLISDHYYEAFEKLSMKMQELYQQEVENDLRIDRRYIAENGRRVCQDAQARGSYSIWIKSYGELSGRL